MYLKISQKIWQREKKKKKAVQHGKAKTEREILNLNLKEQT